MTDETMTIDDYALDLVTSGASSYIQDDLNESEAISDEDWPAARERAKAIVRVIEEHADEILAWADQSQAAAERASA
jgi:hypothetical protein